MISITHIVFAIFFVFIVTISVFVRAKLPSFAREKSSCLLFLPYYLLPIPTQSTYLTPCHPRLFIKRIRIHTLLVWIINLYSTLTILLFGYSPLHQQIFILYIG